MNSNILAVEDDRDTLANLRDILELDGYQVTGVGSLKEAADQRLWSDFSVILLDRRLPDGTADEVLPLIRTAAPNAAVIVLTGYADLEGTIAALRSGAADYLLKPINPDLLRAAIARVASAAGVAGTADAEPKCQASAGKDSGAQHVVGAPAAELWPAVRACQVAHRNELRQTATLVRAVAKRSFSRPAGSNWRGSPPPGTS